MTPHFHDHDEQAAWQAGRSPRVETVTRETAPILFRPTLQTLVPLYLVQPGAFTKREAVHTIITGRRGWANNAKARAKANRHTRQRMARASVAEYRFEAEQDALWMLMMAE